MTYASMHATVKNVSLRFLLWSIQYWSQAGGNNIVIYIIIVYNAWYLHVIIQLSIVSVIMLIIYIYYDI